MYMHKAAICEKRMNLKQSMEGYKEGFRGKKERYVIIIL